jgi:hypothetical protein
MPGYIYLLMMADGVYKVGRTEQEYGTQLKRLRAYPADSVIVSVQKVRDGVVVEREVIRRCRVAFGDHPRGREYFTGPEKELIKIIYECSDFVPLTPPPPPVKNPQLFQTKEIVLNCPKCNKVFTHPKYLSKAKDHLEIHLNRKNACDGTTGTFIFESKNKRDSVSSINDLDLTGLVESLDDELQFCHVIGHIFKVLNDRNCFAVWPNKGVNEVFYKDIDSPMCSPPTHFILKFWNCVMVKQVKPLLADRWPRYTDYIEWLIENTGHPLKEYSSNAPERSMLNFFTRTEVYKIMKSEIIDHLKPVTENASLTCETPTENSPKV